MEPLPIAPVLLVAALLALACAPASSSPPVVAIDPAASSGPPAPPAPGAGRWKVGAYLSLSGEDAAFGAEAREGIELAVQELNAGGGPKRREVEVVFADDRSNPGATTERVHELIEQQKVVALLGEVSSARSRAGALVAGKLGVPMITPTATHPEVTRVGPFVFRACIDDDAQGRAAARFAVGEAKNKRVGLLFGSDDRYSSGLARAFREEVPRLGGTLVAEQSFLKREADVSRQLAEIRRAGPDLIFVPTYYTLVAPLARQAKAAGLRADQLVGSDGWSSEGLLGDAGDELEGARFVDHWVSDAPWPASRAFVERYASRFHHPPSAIAALGYDAAKLLGDALARAREDTPGGVGRALQETRGFAGATGSLSMGEHGEPDKEVVVVRIAGRRFRYHATVRPRSAAAP